MVAVAVGALLFSLFTGVLIHLQGGELNQFAVAACIGVGSAIFLSSLAARHLLRPVERLTALFAQPPHAVAPGSPRVLLPFELKKLRDDIEAYHRRSHQRQQELEEARDQLIHQRDERLGHEATLNAIYENTPFDMWTTDAHGVYSFQNRFSRDIYGDVLGRACSTSARGWRRGGA
ncbi:MAG: hypothetical protein J6386_04265 [Candidatus Synoicihabitans palmerolidicus]|nr:hypothetical protein [Candidatus Synoicihabitans palmerolidicus]